MKLTIKRSQWLRGEGSARSRLLRSSDNKMCCLGILASQLDPTADILDRSSPAVCPKIPWPKDFIAIDGPDRDWINARCSDLMSINDDLRIPEPEREDMLTKEFKKFDIEVEFVD